MKDSAIAPNARAAHASRIVARVRRVVQTGQLEGTNNTIKTIRQTADV